MNIIELGNRIRAQREKKGWSQEFLATEAGLDRSYIGSVERGERNVSFNTLCKIAAAMNLDLSELTKGIQARK